MQSNHKDIFKITAKKKGKPEQLYKELGNFVLHTVYKKLRRPNFLIIKLKGIGSWYLRKKRMETIVNDYPLTLKDTFRNELDLYKYENKAEVHEIFKERLKDYDQYIDERNQIRKTRYATQKLLTGKENSQQTSQD